MSGTEAQVLSFRADRADLGERLDRALARRLAGAPGASRSRIQALIGAGGVRVNGRAGLRPAERLAPGDEVEVDLPARAPKRCLEAQAIPLAILYEDEHLIAVDKPPGLAVHPTYRHPDGTLVNALLAHCRDWGGEGRLPGLVGRLDKGTSGVVVAARAGWVHAALARSPAEKEYLAVAYGRTRSLRGRIDLRILADPADRRRRTTSTIEGQECLTRFAKLGESRGARTGLTALSCALGTGRRHQIRVHLAAAGLPLVGDPIYGAPAGWQAIADPDLAALCRDFPRQALHARRLSFSHPFSGTPLTIEAPLPPDLAGLLAAAGLG